MSINERQHIRFSLDLPATIVTKFGERQETVLQQISIGGCFTGWEENIYPGDEFRMEIELPNGNRLPLACRAIYRFDDTGIGVRFIDISEFEQELISSVIAERLEIEGLPSDINPFARPAKTKQTDKPFGKYPDKQQRERILDEVMAVESVD